MKIAVASEKKNVTEHFGHCENFNIFDVEDNKIVKEESVPNPGHRPGFLPKFLAELGVNVIMSGGIGGEAVDLFDEYGINVLSGVTGDAKHTVEQYLKGTLEYSGSICKEHNHE